MRAFSARNSIKTPLRNRIEYQWMNNIVEYIEKELLDDIDDETIIKGFQNMKNHQV